LVPVQSPEPDEFLLPSRLSFDRIIPAQGESRKSVELQAMTVMHLNAEGSPFYGVEAGGALVFRADKRLRARTGLSYGYYSVDGLGVLSFGKSDQTEDLPIDPSTGMGGSLFDPVTVVQNTIEYAPPLLNSSALDVHRPVYWWIARPWTADGRQDLSV
jgi:hypothetical protein